MTLLRAVPRAMLASYFVASGIKAIRDPESLVPAAEPLADRVVPLVKQYSPDQVSSVVPEDTVTLVRVFGAAQVLGGAALATGKGRRLGALLLASTLVPSTIAKHPFWSVQDPEQRAQDRNHFLKNVSLLGGVLIASVDTEGKPSLAWRAQKGGQASKKLTKGSGRIAGDAGDLAEAAVATGTALVAALSESSRKLQKQAARQLKEAKAVAASQAEEAEETAAKTAKKVKKEVKKQAKVLANQAEEAEETAAKTAKKVKKEVKKQAKVLAKQAKRSGENVQLGEN
jgi:uncharacterized membrane protein YphA (DoxX/SURF4 family)/F0F1-type ATP synthase membrane subunit b/b'